MSEQRAIGGIATAVVAIVALVLAGGAIIVSTGIGSTFAAPAGTQSAADAPSSVSVELSEFDISPDTITVAEGGTLEIANVGSAEHDLAITDADLATPMLGAGESATLELDGLEAGTYEVICTVPGHEGAGMTGQLVIADGAEMVAADADDDGHAGHDNDDGADWAALDQAMVDSILEFPAETEGLGNQPLEPEEILDDGTKVFRLIADRFDWERAPGDVVQAWGYNGQVPGPAIRTDVGDDVRIIVENHLPMGHDVHWHGVRVPNEMDGVAPITQDLIEPGEEFVYEFTTVEPAIGMYHPHHHGQHKLPDGMFGAFIVGDTPIPYGETISGREIPTEEELDIALEIPMILNDAGAIGLSLNGKSFPATEPIVVDDGDWVVIHYYNEGLQEHPMHLHQFPQLVFAKDGIPLESPQWEDTVNVAPGERYSVLVHADDPGTWMFHCHILTHAEGDEGMFGMVTAMIVE